MTENKENKTTNLSEKEHEELTLLYQNAAANLESLKKSQWQVYVFYSAVVAFLILQKDSEILKEPSIKILISLSLLIGVIVVEFFTAHFRFDMLNYRKILKNIYERFGYPFREIRESAKGKKEAELNLFEIIFRHGGSAYIFAVFAYTMVVFWMEELKRIDGLLYVLVLILILLTIFTPLAMDRLVSYIDKKSKVEKQNE